MCVFLLLIPKFWTPLAQTFLICCSKQRPELFGHPLPPGRRHEVRVSPLMASRSPCGKMPRRWLGLLQRWASSPVIKRDHSMPPILGGWNLMQMYGKTCKFERFCFRKNKFILCFDNAMNLCINGFFGPLEVGLFWHPANLFIRSFTTADGAPAGWSCLFVACWICLIRKRLVKIMWYVPPNYFGGGGMISWGEGFLDSNWSVVASQKSKQKREWEMTFKVRFFFPWTNKERQISRDWE